MIKEEIQLLDDPQMAECLSELLEEVEQREPGSKASTEGWSEKNKETWQIVTDLHFLAALLEMVLQRVDERMEQGKAEALPSLSSTIVEVTRVTMALGAVFYVKMLCGGKDD